MKDTEKQPDDISESTTEETNDTATDVNAENDAAAQSEPPAPPKKKRMGRILKNVLLVAAIALGILSLFGIMNEIDPDADTSSVKANPLFCVVLVTVVLASMTLDVSKFCIINKTVTGKVMFKTATKTNFLGKYYDAVTPFGTGGQPMQIYYLNTKGISGGSSSAIVLIRYIFSIMCWIILGIALMIYGAVKGVLNGVTGGSLLNIAGWIGIAVNMIVPTFVIFFLIFPKLMKKLTVGFVKLGKKMHIVKDVDKTTERALKVVDDFKTAFKQMATSPVKFTALILVCFAESFLTFAVPFFVMKAFSCDVTDMLLTIMSLNVFATFGVSFIPTPGNSGVMEGMGALAFSVAAGAALIWSVLTWRLAVFYIYIIIGLIMTVCDIIIKNVKNKKTADAPPTEEIS